MAPVGLARLVVGLDAASGGDREHGVEPSGGRVDGGEAGRQRGRALVVGATARGGARRAGRDP